MTTAAELSQIYDDLNAPSADAFRKALARRGIKARAKDIEEFVRSKTERQVIAPGPKYTGHIVSHGIDQRWAADVISFVSRPVVDKASKTSVAYVLLVQDIFSRQLWARPMETVSDTTDSFANILTETNRKPSRCDTDGGSEFVSSTFGTLMRQHKIHHVIKDPSDRNAISTIDAAIRTLKRAIRRRQEKHGGNWLTQLAPAIKGYNDTPHSKTNAPPNDMSDDIIFSEIKQAAEDMAGNMRQIDKRKARLEKDGGFRTHVGKTGGLKRRTDASTWSKDIKKVVSFPAPGVVKDENGKEYLTKLVKPVPLDSSSVQDASPPDEGKKPKRAAPILNTLRPHAEVLRDLLGAPSGTGKTSTVASRELRTRMPNFPDVLRAANLTFNAFVSKFPDLVQRRGSKLYAV